MASQRTVWCRRDAIVFLREEEANFAELTQADIQPLRDLATSTPIHTAAIPRYLSLRSL